MSYLPESTQEYLAIGSSPGNRNNTLMDAACQFRDAGFSLEESAHALLPRGLADGLGQAEILSTIRSAFSRDPREPCGGTAARKVDMHSLNEKQPIYRKTTVEPQELPRPLDNGAIKFLETKFLQGEFVSIGEGYEQKDDKGRISIPITAGKVRTREAWITDIKQRGIDVVFPSVEGVFVRVNPMKDATGKTDKDVACYRDILIEADTGSLEEQMGAIKSIGLPATTVAWSANRSVQGQFRVNAPDEKTYREWFSILRQYCNEALGLNVDLKNINPSRYSRLPGGRRTRRDHDTCEIIPDSKGEPMIDRQTLLAVNLPGKPWDEWLKSLPIDDGLPQIKSLAEIVAENVPKPPEIITGLLHQGLKLMLGGPSKARKTWILMHLALALASGRKWLGHQCMKGPVLYINFELPEAFFNERAQWILQQMGVEGLPSHFYELNLRGYAGPAEMILPKVTTKIAQLPPLLATVIDPTYKLMGATRDENAAADIASLMNEFDKLTVQTGSSVISAAHFAKGNASVKEAIDRISGSGVFGRDPDSLVIMSPLNTEDAFQLDFILRCLPPKKDVAVRWDTYCFEVDESLDPDDLKKSGRPASHSVEDLLEVLSDTSLSDKDWLQKCQDTSGMSKTTFHRLKKELAADKRVYRSKLDDTWSKTSREASKI